jgi:hypothetical protein
MFHPRIFRIEFNPYINDVYQESFDYSDNYAGEIFYTREIFYCVKPSNIFDVKYFVIDKVNESLENKILSHNGSFVPDEITRHVYPLIHDIINGKDTLNQKYNAFNKILGDYESSLFPELNYSFY